MNTPIGIDQVISTFGDLKKYVHEDGTLDPKWEEEHITHIALPAPLRLAGDTVVAKRVSCHKLVATVLLEALNEIHKEGLWEEINPYGGGFNFRSKRGSDKFSLHCWGIAWDFRPDQNKLDTEGSMHPKVVEIFEKHGFLWGGHFRGRKDPMHVQYCKGA